MKKWILGLVWSGILSSVVAQTTSTEEPESSPTGYIFIGVLMIIVVIFILARRQKRKFND